MEILYDFQHKCSESHHHHTSTNITLFHEGRKKHLFEFHLASALQSIHIPFILVPNIVVLTTFYSIRHLHTPDNFILAGNAVVDIIIAIAIVPIEIIDDFTEILRRTFWTCWVQLSARRLVLGTSLSFLMLMAVERFVTINSVNNRSTNRSIIIAMAVLFVFEIIRGPVLVAFLMNYDLSIADSVHRCHYILSLPPVYVYVADYVKIGIQLSVSLVCCVQVAYVSWRQNKRTRHIEEMFMEKPTHTRFYVEMMIARMFVFVVLWFPVFAVPVVWDQIGYTNNLDIYGIVAQNLMFLNASMANVYIFAMVKPTYRIAFKYIFTHRPCVWNQLATYYRGTLSSETSLHINRNISTYTCRPSFDAQVPPGAMSTIGQRKPTITFQDSDSLGSNSGSNTSHVSFK